MDQEQNLVFMGTPPFAASILEKLATWPLGKIVGVYTQPDRKASRGHKTSISAVKAKAQDLGLKVFQPETLKNPAYVAELADLKPDFLLVAAYGLLLPESILNIPKFPTLNVHASLLPKYRGAAPIQRAILEEYQENAVTGVSIMQIIKALDAGPVYAQASLPIGEHTQDSLLEALAPIGADLLLSVLDKLLKGEIEPKPQDDNLATYAAKIEKADGFINFAAKALKVHAQIRAVTSKPGAQVNLKLDKLAKSLEVKLLPGKISQEECQTSPGLVRLDKDGLAISCQDYWYQLSFVKPQGRSFMPSKAFINGYLQNVPLGLCGKVEKCEN